MKNETMNVEGMSCAHCEAKVEGELGKLPGVAAKADSDGNRVEVSYDEASVDAARLAKAVEDAGYTVRN
ncbi:MAG: heavy-metal-associated domain-containing protein [Rubrobacter sp.]|nr:heavy-metal-associated domain-containing protein [Rubrobacter sp.]